MKLTRYDATYKNDFGDIYQADISEIEDGDLVFYEDAAALEAENAALREKLAAAEARTVLDLSQLTGYEESCMEGGGVCEEKGGTFVKRADVQALVAASAAPARDADDADADHHTIMSLGGLLAEITLIMKGAPKPGKGHSYHDLPKLVEVMKIELEVMKQSSAAPAAQEDAKDAARYRWLRNQNEFQEIGSFSPYAVKGQTMEFIEGADLDKQVDAAIAANTPKGTLG